MFQKYWKCYRLIVKRDQASKQMPTNAPAWEETACFSIHFINSLWAQIQQFFWNFPRQSCFTSEERWAQKTAVTAFPCLLLIRSSTSQQKQIHNDLEMSPPPTSPVYTENTQGVKLQLRIKENSFSYGRYIGHSKCSLPRANQVVLRPPTEAPHCMVGTQFIHL